MTKPTVVWDAGTSDEYQKDVRKAGWKVKQVPPQDRKGLLDETMVPQYAKNKILVSHDKTITHVSGAMAGVVIVEQPKRKMGKEYRTIITDFFKKTSPKKLSGKVTTLSTEGVSIETIEASQKKKRRLPRVRKHKKSKRKKKNR